MPLKLLVPVNNLNSSASAQQQYIREYLCSGLIHLVLPFLRCSGLTGHDRLRRAAYLMKLNAAGEKLPWDLLSLQ